VGVAMLAVSLVCLVLTNGVQVMLSRRGAR